MRQTLVYRVLHAKGSGVRCKYGVSQRSPANRLKLSSRLEADITPSFVRISSRWCNSCSWRLEVENTPKDYECLNEIFDEVDLD